MNTVIRHRLGVLRVIDPVYTFDELKIIKHLIPPTVTDVRLFNVDKNSLSTDSVSGGLRFRCSLESAMVCIDNVTVPENHFVVTKVMIEVVNSPLDNTGVDPTDKKPHIYPVYFYRTKKNYETNMSRTTQPEYTTDLILPFLEPIIDFKYFTVPRKPEDIIQEQKIQFFLHGLTHRESEIPYPANSSSTQSNVVLYQY
jgi:hypothetical protein